MNKVSWISFRTLVEQKNKPSLLNFLSPPEQEKFRTVVSTAKKNPFIAPHATEERLSRVHYSWLIMFLEPLAEGDKKIVLSALDSNQTERLKEHFRLKRERSRAKKGVKSYLITVVYRWLIADQKEFLPLEFLPDHPLNPLTDLPKKELQNLIDSLGLHDLAIELKHIIKSDQIKKIQKVLIPEEQKFLKKEIKVKDPITFSRLNLDSWNGDREMLKAILHHRGLNRLAKALFGCHPSLLWHICHTLDTGRTKILRNFFTDIKNDKVHATLIDQILDLIQGW
ncbi:MAG: hypothetical protein AAGE99_01465 [Chlamydiota bacterium]